MVQLQFKKKKCSLNVSKNANENNQTNANVVHTHIHAPVSGTHMQTDRRQSQKPDIRCHLVVSPLSFVSVSLSLGCHALPSTSSISPILSQEFAFQRGRNHHLSTEDTQHQQAIIHALQRGDNSNSS